MAKTKQTNWNNINTYLIIALVIVIGIGLYFTLSVPTIKKETTQIQPKLLQATLLGTDCEDCFNISVAIDFLNQQAGINVTEVKELTTEESNELASKYNITRLPALVLTGETENLTIPNFETKEDALIFAQSPPPYYDISAKRIKGKVSVVTLSDSTCTDCFDMSQILNQLKQAGLKVVTEQTIDSKSTEGQNLISKYKIEKIPTMIFNNEALEYEIVSQVWSEVGTTETDGKLVLRFVNPPYVNVSSGKVEGKVTLSYLVDETCAECYNASIFQELMTQAYGMKLEKEETIDIESTKGKLLIKKYNITAVPTIVLSKEAGAYQSLEQSWNQVGTKEKDGTFVFRQMELLKGYFDQIGQSFTYKNTETGELVMSEAPSAEEPEVQEAEIEE